MTRLRIPIALAAMVLATACRSGPPETIEDARPYGHVCFPRNQPDARGEPNGSDAVTRPTTSGAPATQPTTQAAVHGAPGHWCALCAAAAARQAESGRAHASLIAPDADLTSDLPPR